MKILFVSTKGPLPLNDGHSLRTFHLLRQAARRHDIYLLSFVKFPEEYEYIPDLKDFCREVIFIDLSSNRSVFHLGALLVKNMGSHLPLVAQKYYTSKMQAAIRGVTGRRKIDLVHLDMLPLCSYLYLFAKIPVVLNEHNVESALLARLVSREENPYRRWFYALQQKRLERFERSVLRKCSHVICCSHPDRELLSGLAPRTPISVLPNGVDLAFFKPSGTIREDGKRLVFIGGMNWFPNRDAMQWFDRDVMPRILARHPDIMVDVIGRGDNSIEWKHASNITMHGYVEDVRPYMERAAVFIVPLRIGGGTRLKILNAMAMEKAIVSTNIGIEGLEVQEGWHFVAADTADAFAEAVNNLVSNSASREGLGRRARGLASSRYNWDFIGKQLLGVYEKACSCC